MGSALDARFDLSTARQHYVRIQPKKPKPLVEDLQRDLKSGWLLPYLFQLDDWAWGRWSYWADLQWSGDLPAKPIPAIDFCSHNGDSPWARKMWERCLDGIGRNGSGSWAGWSSWVYVDYLFDWLLYGFGHGGQKELPAEPKGCEGASMRLYQLFDLSPLVLWPYDHLAELLAETHHGRGNGFFPTPHCVVEMMVRMTMSEGDHRAETVCDPCVGSGRMLLHASNHSLRLYGQDIDATLCKATLINGYLWAPWLVRPIAWLDREAVVVTERLQSNDEFSGEDEEEKTAAIAVATGLSDHATEIAPLHYQARLFDTEFDAEGTRKTAPILKRRKRAGASETQTEQLNLLEV